MPRRNAVGVLTVVENLTLDGVMQAPGRCDEDVRDGFAHGGWAQPYSDPVMAETMGKGDEGKGMAAADVSLLFGRRTYEDFAGFWPKQADNPVTAVLNARRKFVVPTTLDEPLPWQNFVLLPGEAAKSVAVLKEEVADDLVVLGGELCRTLAEHDLVDRYTLLVDPLVLGTGCRRLDSGRPARGSSPRACTRRARPPCCTPAGTTCSSPTARSPRARNTWAASRSSGRPTSMPRWRGAAGSPR
jgi:dihydrofolate reductase